MSVVGVTALRVWIAIAGAAAFAHVTTAAEPASAPARALSILAELGLPDTRGAKWVRAHVMDASSGMQELPAKEGTQGPRGNAWLVREEKGSLTLVMQQTRVVRVRQGKADMPDDDGGAQPMAQYEPADLKADLATIAEGLDSFAADLAEGAEVVDYLSAQRAPAIGQALLLLAHLQRRGHPGVDALLGKALAAGPPHLSLDAATHFLADARLAELNERWAQTGDAAAYASSLEALAGEFHRGWSYRGAALLLARKVRGKGGGEAANSPAAELLLALQPADAGRLPLQQNWVFPPGGAHSGMAHLQQYGGRGRARFAPSPAPPAQGAPAGPLEVFFQQRVKAARELVPLLEDQRLLRLLRKSEDGPHRVTPPIPGLDDDSPEESEETLYRRMPRPYALGELAAELLQSILPQWLAQQARYRHHQAPDLLQLKSWVDSLDGKTDEELAWIYLRNSISSAEETFRAALTFLVEQGSPATLPQLREVFLDPAVWQSHNPMDMAALLKTYAGKLGADGDAFSSKVLDTIKADLTAAGEPIPGMPEDYRKRQALAQMQQFKQIEQLLRPRPLAALLKDFASAAESDAPTLLAPLRAAVREDKSGAAEAQVFQAAAAAGTPGARKQLVDLLGPDFSQGEPPAAVATAAPFDDATRAAVQKLLADESMPEPVMDGRGAPPMSVAFATAGAILGRRVPPAKLAELGELYGVAIHLVERWWREAAAAALEGKPLPPVPRGPALSAQEVAALARPWEGLSGSEVLAAARALPLQQQFRLIRGLAEQEQWPAPLAAAQLTVTAVQAEAQLPGAAQWKGRLFDEALSTQMTEAVAAAAAGGNGVIVSVASGHPLSGFTISIAEYPDTVDPSSLADLGLAELAKGTPPPDAVLTVQISNPDGNEAESVQPYWRDAGRNEAWAKAHSKPAEKSAPPAKHSRPPAVQSDPQACAALLSRLQKGEPALLLKSQVSLYASPVRRDEEP